MTVISPLPPNTYYAKTLVTRQANFYDAAGALTDPTAITLTVQNPDGTTSTPSPTHVSTGIYTINLDTTAYPGGGTYALEWVGTGTCQAVGVDSFTVLPLPF